MKRCQATAIAIDPMMPAIKEAAAAIGCSEKMVERAWRDGLEYLRGRLEE